MNWFDIVTIITRIYKANVKALLPLKPQTIDMPIGKDKFHSNKVSNLISSWHTVSFIIFEVKMCVIARCPVGDTRRLFEWNLSLPIGISIVCGFKGKSALTFA
jgi:hypothetical protein